MTIEKAIRAIRHDLHWKLLKGYQEDVAKIAISALEKQIPKKPVEKTLWTYRCPNCNSQKAKEVFIERFKYCRDCGQALDWSETDD